MTVAASLLRDAIQRRGHPRSLARGIPLAASAALTAIAALATAPGAQATPVDRASTRTYLQALYTLEVAFIHGAPQSRVSVDALAGRIGGECAGVLAGAPQQDAFIGLSHSPARPLLSPKASGEAQRSARQLAVLEGELFANVLAAQDQPDQQAIVTFAHTITQLTWSKRRISQLVRDNTALFVSLLEPSAPSVCADMRAWAASGYHTLLSASRLYEAEEQGRQLRLRATGSLDTLLKPYVDRADIRRTKALALREISAFSEGVQALDNLRGTLGLKVESPPPTQPGTVVSRGRTRAGERYTVSVGPPTGENGPGCVHELSVEFGTSSNVTCISHGHDPVSFSVGCEEGLLRIEVAVPLKTRRVRLRLSDGTSVTSRAVFIPARLGGPLRLYVQALRGPSPIPVSLTELDGRDRSLGVVELHAPRHCVQQVALVPRFVTRTIVHGVTSAGTRFAIEGTNAPVPGHDEFKLRINTGQLTLGEPRPGEASNGARPSIFAGLQFSAGCLPRQYVIVYGLLKTKGASVLVRTDTGLVRLAKVEIPAALHTSGVLVYGAFTTFPSEVVVVSAAGRVLVREDLSRRATEETQFCEGYAEP